MFVGAFEGGAESRRFLRNASEGDALCVREIKGARRRKGIGGVGGIQLNRPLTEKQLQQNEAVETEEEVQEQHCVKMK